MKLSSLGKAPEKQWFFFKPDGFGGLEQLAKDDPETMVLAGLQLTYLSTRERRDLIDANSLRRAAVSKGGMKGIMVQEDMARRRLVAASLKDWVLTLRGANLMGLTRNIEDQDADAKVSFDAENLEIMVKESRLVDIVVGLLDDHQAWFPVTDTKDDEEGDGGTGDPVGNSGTGPNSNSAGQPAAPASTATSPSSKPNDM